MFCMSKCHNLKRPIDAFHINFKESYKFLQDFKQRIQLNNQKLPIYGRESIIFESNIRNGHF